MTRLFFIQRIVEQLYGGKPPDSRSISDNMVNSFLNDGIAVMAKESYKENLKIDNIAYVNNSFYTSYKNLAITSGDTFGEYESILPQIPIGIGRNEGIASAQIKIGNNLSKPVIILTPSQWNQFDLLPQPTGVPCLPEGNKLLFKSTLGLNIYTVTIRMISGGDSTDLTSIINVPDEWFDALNTYVLNKLLLEKSQPKVNENTGIDNTQK